MLEVKMFDNNITFIKIFSPRELEDEDKFFFHLEDLISNKKFGIVIEVEGDKTFSLEAKQKLNIWFKNNKYILRKSCIGMARINSNVSKLKTLKSKAISLAMPCPYIVLSGVDEAIRWFQKNNSLPS